MAGPWNKLGLAAMAAATTVVASSAAASSSTAGAMELPHNLHLKASPFLLYAAHPSLPLPPFYSPLYPCEPPLVPSPPGKAPPPPQFPSSSVALAVSLPSLQSFTSFIRQPAAALDLVSSHFSVIFQRGEVSVPHVAPLLDLLTPSCQYYRPVGHVRSLFNASSLQRRGSLLQTVKGVCYIPFVPSCLYSTSGSWHLRQYTGASASVKPAFPFHPSIFSQIYDPLTHRYPNSHLTSLFSSVAFNQHARVQYPNPASTHSAWAKYLYAWYDVAHSQDSEHLSPGKKPVKAVVLLGWLGAQQKHLKLYADWYTERGLHAVTFVFPMSDVLSFQPRGKAEEDIDLLVNHLALWLKEGGADGEERLVVFHTFSNTGWLTYGAVLEKLLKEDATLVDKIKGCVVDSAPVPDLSPQVWASGFSAALLKKRSVTTKGSIKANEENTDDDDQAIRQPQPSAAETAILAVLEKFFSIFLQLPPINRRLSEVVSVLAKRQPPCPQLYMYSTADRVIPADSVESYIEQQRQAGRKVSSCNLQYSPHVDHFRNFPEIYSAQLTAFLEECLAQCAD